MLRLLAAHVLSHQASTKTVANEVPKSSVHNLAHNIAHNFLLRLLAAHNLAHQASMKTVAHEALKSSAHILAHNIAHIFLCRLLAAHILPYQFSWPSYRPSRSASPASPTTFKNPPPTDPKSGPGHQKYARNYARTMRGPDFEPYGGAHNFCKSGLKGESQQEQTAGTVLDRPNIAQKKKLLTPAPRSLPGSDNFRMLSITIENLFSNPRQQGQKLPDAVNYYGISALQL